MPGKKVNTDFIQHTQFNQIDSGHVVLDDVARQSHPLQDNSLWLKPSVHHTAGFLLGGSSIQEHVKLVDLIRQTGKPNVYGAQIPLQTNWNLELMRHLAESTSDREVVQFLQFGWPLNHDGRQLAVVLHNHPSAEAYYHQVTDYITTEMQMGSLLGPFAMLPWQTQVAVSPLSMTSKKDSPKRRILMDMSWPHDGTSVNDGIPRDVYLHQPYKLQYPTIDALCRRAVQLRGDCFGYKKDIFMDPSDWPKQGIFWQGALFFDMTAVTGSRTGPYVCQCCTSFIRHVMNNLKYFLVNYIDDFMGLEKWSNVWSSYRTLGRLLRDIGAKEANEKAVPPCTVLEFLGVLFDLVNMTIGVMEQRKLDLLQELRTWSG